MLSRAKKRSSLTLQAMEKYANIDARYFFDPTAVETLGVINTSACHLLNDLIMVGG